MMEENFNFNNCLLPNETIIYQCRPVPGKGSKQIGGFSFITLFSLALLALVMWGYSNSDKATRSMLIVFIIVIGLFLLIGLYGLIHNLFFKAKQVADDYYCLTNMRALKYESKKKKLTCGYLVKFNEISCENVKDNYGDIYFTNTVEGYHDEQTELAEAIDIIRSSKPDDAAAIFFESIENPEKVYEMAIKARNDILGAQQNNQ